MKERPILFSAPMVRALLDGSKTQTRRVVKLPPSWDCVVYSHWGDGMWWPYRSDDGENPNYDNSEIPLACPFGKPGDRLWVRETHRAIWGQSPGYLIGIDYKADPQEKWERMRDHGGRPNWTPSIHMRREYSRILLEIVSVRVERLNDCSDTDAVAEGIGLNPSAIGVKLTFPPDESMCVNLYRQLWESINGPGSWAVNPWVWVVEFKRVTP